MKNHSQGFTLVELVVVMVIVAVLATGLVVFFQPALNNYLAVGRRAALSDQADGAMRLMMRDIRLAVPNSMRQPDTRCFELVPGSAGGRFRTAPDQNNTDSLPLEASQPVATFDVFMPQSPVPAQAGDWLVIGNQNADDLYNTPSPSRSLIQKIAVPPASPGALPAGTHRITLNAPANIPPGHVGSRFMVVPSGTGPVLYTCNPGSANGNGTGQLLRYSSYGFNPVRNNCAPPANIVGAVVANNVSACTMTYNPNPGATEASGYMSIALTLTSNGESVALTYGAHANNMP